ncbi:mitochondrial ribosomal protein L37-domain-containing protein [Lenzites betulinus]|nr:mitochondrial ribosomal protein L37-domain-containing protein [Lenzites betulinus]
MSFVQTFRRQLRLNAFCAPRRCLASQSAPATAPAHPEAGTAPTKTDAPALAESSCTENTVLVGVNYLKGQPEVLAQADDAYPPWLWTLLQPKQIPDDGPGGKGEKIRLRKANRQRIRDQNFMKTQ